MTDTITHTIVREAADTLNTVRLPEGAEIHTVTLTLNGGHGGVDMKVEAIYGVFSTDWRRTVVVGAADPNVVEDGWHVFDHQGVWLQGPFTDEQEAEMWTDQDDREWVGQVDGGIRDESYWKEDA